jgi:hypothetical protein
MWLYTEMGQKGLAPFTSTLSESRSGYLSYSPVVKMQSVGLAPTRPRFAGKRQVLSLVRLLIPPRLLAGMIVCMVPYVFWGWVLFIFFAAVICRAATDHK